MCEKASKGRFLKPEKLQNHSTEGKAKEKKKERGEGKEERKKGLAALLVVIVATLEIVFARKKLLHAKGPFGERFQKSGKIYLFTYLVGVRKDVFH